MDKLIEQKYLRWINEKSLSEEERNELKEIKDEKEITERFISSLEFGTAGLRGVMAMGTNRMNRFVIRQATQGLAQYLLSEEAHPTVAIAYDSRNNSEAFAKESASVLAANGIKVFIYDELMPVPALSFAVRQLHTTAGIVITASHNPKQYNGFKVYGADGCQLTPKGANAVLENINKLDIFNDVKRIEFEDGLKSKEIEFISNDIVEKYYASVLKQSILSPEVSQRVLKITYTPLHGAGLKPVTTALKRDGFNKIDIVKEQELPDGNFTTCPYPNPEIFEAMELGIKLMLENDNDILIATDPDSDRCGAAVNQNGKAIILTGNEIGILLFDFIYHARKEENKLPKDAVVVKSLVSSDLINLMGKKWGVNVVNVLTGFKYIGEQILLLEEKGQENRYILGFEESYGYLTNTDVRDKDAVNAALLLAELANYYKLKGLTLIDRLQELYNEFGEYKTVSLPYSFPGLEGKDKMAKLMKDFRDPKVYGKLGKVVGFGDYLVGTLEFDGKIEPTGLPKTDLVKVFLEDNETVVIRPSGTEPKVKAYVFAKGDKRVAEIKSIIDAILQ